MCVLPYKYLVFVCFKTELGAFKESNVTCHTYQSVSVNLHTALTAKTTVQVVGLLSSHALSHYFLL